MRRRQSARIRLFWTALHAAIEISDWARRTAPVILLVGTLLAGAAVWMTTSARANHWVWKGWERLFGPASINNAAPHVFPQLGGSGNYTITAIDEPSAGTSALEGTFAFGVNASGAVTGAYSNQTGVGHGFVYANGTFTSFDAPNAGSSPQSGWFQGTTGIGIDTAGDVAGVYADSNSAYHGFFRSAANGTITALDDPNAPTTTTSRGTFPIAINDNGQIAGFYTTGSGASSLYHGFLYSVSSKNYTEIDEPSAGTGGSIKPKEGTIPFAINASGAVTGYYVDSSSNTHGFIYSAGNYTSFDVPGDFSDGHSGLVGTVPMSIDTAGDVIGSWTDSNLVRHGFVRSASGTITTFDAPGATAAAQSGTIDGTFPTAIDPTGSYIAGLYSDSSGLIHGFVESQPLTSNPTFTTFSAPQASTSSMAFAFIGTLGFGVNASGTVSGSYLDSNEVVHGFIYTPTATQVAATPTLSLPTGTYDSVQTITISDATPGATIYYTTNGTTPTTTSTVYSGPILVSSSETIEAIAAASGYAGSAVATATYTLNLTGTPYALAPVFSPGGGDYTAVQSVTITDATPGSSIYYTLDGSAPTGASTPYTAPVTISTSGELQAIAIAPGYAPSDIAAASYQISGTNLPQYVYNVAGTGQLGYNGDGVPATQADLTFSLATATDSSGNLYIADTGNNRIRMVSAATGLISTYAGTETAGYSGDGGQATAAQLSSPSGLAVEGGNLYIADTGNGLIREVNSSTGVITTYAGDVLSGSPVRGCNATGTGVFLSPRSIAFGPGFQLYVADPGCDVVWQVAAGGAVSVLAGKVQTFGYAGDSGPATSAELNQPFSVAVDSAENVYIADWGNNRIREVLAGAGTIQTVAGNGTFGSSGDGGPATAAEIEDPYAVTLDSSANIYLSNLFSIRLVTAKTGIISTFAGVSEPSSGNTDGALSIPNVLDPESLSFGSNDALYFYDAYSARVRMVSAPGPAPSTAAATPVISVNSGTYSSPQTVTITDATPDATIYFTLDGSTPTGSSPIYHGSVVVTGTSILNAIAIAPGFLPSAPAAASYTITPAPSTVISTIATAESVGIANAGCFGGVALDKANDIYVIAMCLQDDYVYKISASTGKATLLAGTGEYGYAGDGESALDAEFEFTDSSGIAVDSSGNIYVADTYNNRVRVINAQTGVITTFAGTGTYGDSGDGGAAASAQLAFPQGLAFDAQGNLYIADSGNNIVRMVSAQNGNISTVAGTPQSYGYSGDGGLATSATLENPQAIALDSTGNLYIGDEGYRIRKVTKATGDITTFAGNGEEGATGDGGPALNAQIIPGFMVADTQNNLYVSNLGAGVREVYAANGNISTVVGDGYIGYWGDGGPPTNAGLWSPTGIVFDTSGDLIIADLGNGDIREVAPAVATPTFSPAAGIYTSAQTVTISDSTAGATIYYTTNGDTPTTSSTVYNGPIAVSSSETIQAIAAIGYDTSGIGFAAYTITPVAATPTFSPVAGTYTSAQTVTISDGTSGSTIYYTTNGTTPTTSSTVYSGPITVSSSETIDAIAVASGYANSAVATAIYTINASPVLSSLSPAFVEAGNPTINLTVNGTGFVSGSTVYWNSTALTTTNEGPNILEAAVSASDLASPGTAAITVQSSSPGGGPSNTLEFEIQSGSLVNDPVFSTVTATVAPGQSANYPVTLPSGATDVTATCLNLPAGAGCVYQASSGLVTILTLPSTPAGTYQITVVFTETLPGAATGLIILPFLLLPLAWARRRWMRQHICITACMGMALLVGAVSIGCGGGNSGGGGGGGGGGSQTHTVTTSGVVSLTVQ